MRKTNIEPRKNITNNRENKKALIKSMQNATWRENKKEISTQPDHNK